MCLVGSGGGEDSGCRRREAWAGLWKLTKMLLGGFPSPVFTTLSFSATQPLWFLPQPLSPWVDLDEVGLRLLQVI